MKLALRATSIIVSASIAIAGIAQPAFSDSTSSQSNETSDGKTALLRVTVVDPVALQSASFGVGQKIIGEAAIEKAEAFGAIKKSTFATYLARNNVVSFWKSDLAQKGSDIFNNEMLQNLSATKPDVVNKLKKTYPKLFNGTSFNNDLPSRTWTTSPLSLTKTIPQADGGRSVTELTLLESNDPRAQTLTAIAKRNGMLSADANAAIAALSTQPPAPSSPVHVYYVRVPATEAHDWVSAINKEAGANAAVQITNPLDIFVIHPAETTPSAQPTPFQFAKKTASHLKSIFDHPPVMGFDKRPVLIILDDAFPSQQAWEDSKKFFSDAVDKIYTTYASKDDSQWLTPFKNIPDAQNEPAKIDAPRNLIGCEAGLATATCKFHAKSIEQALSNLQTIETPDKQPVRVVWLPLLNSQKGSFAQIAKVFRIAETVTGMNQLGYGNIRKYSPTGFAWLQEDLKSLQDNLQNSYPDSVNDWRAPTPILAAVTNFAQWYSHATTTPVFINFSWTFDAKIDGPRPESGFYKTALIVAAGNPCTQKANCNGYTEDINGVGDYDFLRTFISYPNRYIFAANVDASGNATCASAQPRPQSGVFAFPGNIPGDCGSSFSAPRVAWLLAAREAYRKLDASYSDEVGKWFPFVYKLWFEKRNMKACKNPTDLSCAVLDIDSLFSDIDPL
ncbi:MULTISPECIES: hypothetical protein [unclassified Burkholderia]|uniref:hypothetical protein n=1 Tax=unclassified Burkholderia TaxID=2613784 RepID=UPI002AB17274|nr:MULTISPECIES: hypothetical protein [unclassified Burkholderia]